MADLKISQLSSATALAGTEVVPVVQGGSTKKATIDQILAPASGKGINFSAAGGDTLTMYDEGPWTGGTITGGNCSSVSLSNATYTRVGRLVTLFGRFSATLTTTATETYIVFNVPINMASNTSRAVGSVCHTLATAFPGLGVVIDNSGGEASSVSLDIPAGQVTKVNGTAFTADFTFTYEVA